MAYVKINKKGRVESVSYVDHLGDGEIEVTLPDGDPFEYRYESGEWIHDPQESVPEPVPKTALENKVEKNEADIAFIAMMLGVDMEG